MKIHLDLDSFFVSAERTKNRKLLGKPVAVGGRGDPFIFRREKKTNVDSKLDNKGAFVPSIFYDSKTDFESYFVEGEKIRGIVITSSYEARQYGVKTGMSIREALQICPSLIVLPPNHLFYHTLSHKLKIFLEKEIPAVEQFSIDEFFGDLSGWVDDDKIEPFLKNLQQKILKNFGLPISIGAAKSKWTAKIATTFAKPFGVKVVRENELEAFLKNIPIEKFPGIGRGYTKRLKNYGIKNLGEIKDLKSLFYIWKKPGILLYKRILGIDNEPVCKESPRKSIGISRTIDPTDDREELKRRVIILSRHLAYTVSKLELNPLIFYISLRYEFGGKGKAHIHLNRIFGEKLLKDIMLELFKKADRYPYAKVIRIGIRCTKFYCKNEIFNIFEIKNDKKSKSLLKKCGKIRSKYGVDAIRWGGEMI
ncbi:DNA polymerase Y family protein [Nitrosophilus alvini]|uniref:DNA polymerase Y family protein n=1 Tax=Nitrosophilus alvini TaxID=2714855 RepID=UPI001909CCFF|nr:DNA polymerase IV [Nitrosophilus alvini]